MANWYVSYPQWLAVTPWAPGVPVTVGAIVRQAATPVQGFERCFRCTTPGTTGASEPTWVTNKGTTTADGTAQWLEITGNEAYQTPGSWAAPCATLVNGAQWCAGGDTVFVDKSHSYTYNSAAAIGGGSITSPKRIFSVDASAASHVPPQPADLAKGATELTSGTNTLTPGQVWSEINGVTLIQGSGAAGSTFSPISGTGSFARFRNCTIGVGSTGASVINMPAGGGSRLVLENTQLSFGSTSSYAQWGGEIWFKDCQPLLAPGSAIPTSPFRYSNSSPVSVTLENSDLTGFTGGALIPWTANATGYIRFMDCKLPPGIPITTVQANAGVIITLSNCDSGGVIGRHEFYSYQGGQFTETAIVRTSGSAYGTMAFSWRIAVNTLTHEPFYSMPLGLWVQNTGTQTLTLEGVWNGAVLPTQDDIFMEVRYPGTIGSTLGARATSGKANGLTIAASNSASTAAWDSLVPARSNSAPVSLGTVIKTASAPGKIWFCTQAGTTAGAEPAGYAVAADGTPVADGTAVFRAGVRFKIQATINPAVAGLVTAQVRAGKISSTFYVDPQVTVS